MYLLLFSVIGLSNECVSSSVGSVLFVPFHVSYGFAWRFVVVGVVRQNYFFHSRADSARLLVGVPRRQQLQNTGTARPALCALRSAALARVLRLPGSTLPRRSSAALSLALHAIGWGVVSLIVDVLSSVRHSCSHHFCHRISPARLCRCVTRPSPRLHRLCCLCAHASIATPQPCTLLRLCLRRHTACAHACACALPRLCCAQCSALCHLQRCSAGGGCVGASLQLRCILPLLPATFGWPSIFCTVTCGCALRFVWPAFAFEAVGRGACESVCALDLCPLIFMSCV
jgi:hypothetical protein